MSDDGLMYFIDPKTGDFINKEPTILGKQFTVNRLIDSRFDQASNMLVMRDQASQFHWIKNVGLGLTVNRFTSSPDLEEAAGDDETLISDYIIIPADRSGSSKPELLVADPEEGFHLLLPEEERVAKHFRDLGELN